MGALSKLIPPHVPPQAAVPAPAGPDAWPETTLLGRTRANFTFHLGPPGADRGYQALARTPLPGSGPSWVEGRRVSLKARSPMRKCGT